MRTSESIVSRRPRYAAGPVRRLRLLGQWLVRRPWVIVTLFLLLGVVASVAIARWPTQVPWTTFTFLAVAAGLFLEPRLLVTVYVGHFIALVTLGVILGPTKPATIGAQIATLATMALMLWLSNARAEAGVVGVGGESMLVDMRDRLRAQGELPALPPSWGAEVALESAYGDGFAGDFVVASRSTNGRMLEVALESAYGDSFAGDFVVASRSTDGRTLEIALVDVSGKGREAGARSLLLSGALGGLLGEMSEGGFLASANNHLLRLRWAEGFATAVHVAVDLESGNFTIGYAGHPAAAQFAAGSGRWRMLSGGRGPR